MASEDGLKVSRIDSTKATEWPKNFDVKVDTFMPGKAATFERQLLSALRSRKLLDAIEEAPITLQALQIANPAVASADLIAAFDVLTMKRQTDLATIADNLPATIKYSSLTLQEQEEVNTLVTTGDGIGLYEKIRSLTDLAHPRVQDKLRQKFSTISIKPTDNIMHVRAQVDLKWFLFKHHGLFDVLAQQREGLRMIMQMLLSGPTIIATEAMQTITQIESMPLPPGGANAYITSRLEAYERYGDLMHTPSPSGGAWESPPLMVMSAQERGCTEGCEFQLCFGPQNPEGGCLLTCQTVSEATKKKGSPAQLSLLSRAREERARDPSKPVKDLIPPQRPGGKGGKGGKGGGRGRGGRGGGRGGGGRGGFFGMMMPMLPPPAGDVVATPETLDAALLGSVDPRDAAPIAATFGVAAVGQAAPRSAMMMMVPTVPANLSSSGSSAASDDQQLPTPRRYSSTRQPRVPVLAATPAGVAPPPLVATPPTASSVAAALAAQVLPAPLVVAPPSPHGTPTSPPSTTRPSWTMLIFAMVLAAGAGYAPAAAVSVASASAQLLGRAVHFGMSGHGMPQFDVSSSEPAGGVDVCNAVAAQTCDAQQHVHDRVLASLTQELALARQ